MAQHNIVGAEGEEVAAQYLKSRGFTIVSRNFRRPYGEIDIVARETSGKLVFVEVKTVSWETPFHMEQGRGSKGVSYGTDTYRPEDNVHPQKLKRLSRTIEAYLLTKHYEGDWRFDVIAVYLNPTAKEAKIRHTEDIVIGA